MSRRFLRVPVLAVLLLVPIATPTIARAACPADSLFPGYTLYSVGNSPFRVLSADFNRDGRPDIASVDNGSHDVGILLGAGDGSFAATVTNDIAPGPGHITAADFNGDTFLDLAINSSGTNQVSVLFGHGDGTFAPFVAIAAGSTPYGVTHGDFNSDGRADIAVANFLGNSASVLLGNGSGGFAAPVAYPAGTHPYFIASADFNHDGIADLAVTNQDGANVSILLGRGSGGHGDGTFNGATNYGTGAYPYSLATGDFNADGITDLVTANGGSGGVSVLLGNGSGGAGNGTFAPAVAYASGPQPRAVVTGDADGDGIRDLAIADYSGNVMIMPGLGSAGTGNGTFASSRAYVAGTNATGLCWGDFNLDSLPDLAVANYGTSSVAVLLHGCGSPTPPPPPPPIQAPTLTRVRDVPADQGGRVFVTWLRSGLDIAGGHTITGYRIWRRIMPEAFTWAPQDRGGAAALVPMPWRTARVVQSGASTQVTYWEAIAELPAQALEGYGYTAPTTQDSMPGGNPYTAFFVTALTPDPALFFESNVDSGYSVDNLSPSAPVALNAVYQPGHVALHWLPNPEADLSGYRIYRAPASAGPGTDSFDLIAEPRDTGYVDLAGDLTREYAISAMDLHGNEGPRVVVVPPLATATQVAIAATEADPDRVHLEWAGNAPAGSEAAVYRCPEHGPWSRIGAAVASDAGRLVYDDRGIVSGGRYGYRLEIGSGGSVYVTPEVWIDVPRVAFALQGALPNPARAGAVSVAFTLASAAPATLELIDTTGRRVMQRTLAGLGAGRHVVAIERSAELPIGVYAIRLVQAGRAATAKAIVLER